ncbi:hypothetical protein ACFQAT_00190 [Undibacterium arcticum]|uniref:hypothetical protein n=1 Tax=Undibacterium arcticum TaxID=1762892 RepID=UPI0036204B83
MIKIRSILLSTLFALLTIPLFSQAEDTDIYGGTGSGGVPNVLMVMDTGANFSSSAAVPCTAYAAGGAPSLGNTGGGVEQCALVDAINSLPVGTVNVGIMVNNGNNFTNGAATGVGPCVGSNGGCLVKPLTLMDAAGKTALINFIKSWQLSGNNSATAFTIKSGGDRTGSTMQEAWAYYTGKTGLSGKNYATSIIGAGCEKNFVIFIGNSFSNSGGPADTAQSDPNDSSVGLNSSQVGATAAQKIKLSNTVKFASMTCGVTSLAAGTQSSDWSENWADEWARYMYGSDASSTLDGTQNIITYTIGVINNGTNSCKPDYPALLTNMATYGGGKYFQTGTSTEVKNAILKILNEVQATNSVFSSSSLPVSVNTQGTYLNQIYMGMFRPDASANPRWLGNLKQYQFILNGDNLKLGDASSPTPQLAISSAKTGFISPNAISFWTTKNLAAAPDSTGGFYVNAPNGAGLGFDSPDGELVEKGGAAQQLRVKNLTDTYTAASALTRNLYTYCPGGTGCVAQLSNSANAFATSNAAITDALLNSVSGVSVSTITRSGTTATVTTARNHGFANGASVTISGATQTEYNGTFTITWISNTSFSYPVAENPPSPATGNYTATIPGNPQLIASIIRSGTTATVTLNNHGYANGQTVTITGATQAQYNGTFSITMIDNNHFSYAVVEGPISPAGGGTAKVGSTTRNIAVYNNNPNPGVVRAAGSTTVTVTTTANHGFATGNTATITGIADSAGNVIPGYNGSFVITNTGNKSFTYTIAATTPASPATGSAYADGSAAAKTVTSLTRSGTTATATVSVHGFVNGETVSIGGTTGANENAYVGSYVISGVTANTFNYTVALSPVSPATGTITASVGGTSDRTALINWVRGEDNFGDEASPGNGYTVRPSIHGDVLHSRPVVINYGGTTGVVVYYGANDGVFRAVNGNQSNAIGGVAAGGEMWGLVLPEFYSKLTRQRTNSPALLLPSTPTGITPAPQKKDYFVDGATGVYQQLNTDGTTRVAHIYLTMRRGGTFIYALNVTDPANPRVLWKKSTTDLPELGQTWSRPKVAVIKANTNPVLIFGAGYDTTEDSEPPIADTKGRGIFVLDAVTGDPIWSATPDTAKCPASGVCKTVSGMNFAIPSDVTALDRDNDGKTDRLYVADVGGNVWRVDIDATSPSNWIVSKLATLGGSGAAPRKFFYPPSVVPIGTSGSASSYDAVMIGSGDREHPLYSSSANSAYMVQNRFYMLKDMKTGKDGSGQTTVTDVDLFDATSTNYVDDVTKRGFYINFLAGERL